MTLISIYHYQFEMYQLSFHFACVYGGVVKWDFIKILSFVPFKMNAMKGASWE